MYLKMVITKRIGQEYYAMHTYYNKYAQRIVACLLKARIVEREGSAGTRELHGKHVSAVTNTRTHATIKKPWKRCLLRGRKILVKSLDET
jgi:hypothetical protein